MTSFHVQLTDKRVRVVLHPRGPKRTLYAAFSYHGQRYHISTGHAVEREARVQARALVESAAARAGRGIVRAIAAEVADYLSIRWPAVKPGNASYLDAKCRLNRFAAWCASVNRDDWHVLPLKDATATLQHFIDHRRKSVGAQSLKNDRVVISAFASFLIKRNLTAWPANPAASNRIESPRVIRTIAKPLTRDSIERFLSAVQHHPIHAVCVLILSGLRPKAAMTAIRWEHIDLESGRIITTEKGKPRQLPLSPWAIEALTHHAGKPNARVWTNSLRKGFSHCEALAVAAGTPEITLQALRRAFIFRLWEMGVSPQLASKLAGNTVETAMKHYADSSLLDAAPVVERLDWSGTQDRSKSAPKEPS